MRPVGNVHISRHFNLSNKCSTTQHSVLLTNVGLNVSVSPLFRQSLYLSKSGTTKKEIIPSRNIQCAQACSPLCDILVAL